MKKKLSLIYQYYLLKGIKHAYLDALLTMVFFIGLHIFILQEIISRIGPKKKNSLHISIFLSPNFPFLFCFGIMFISYFIFTREKLLEKKYSYTIIKKYVLKLFIYLAMLFILLLLIQYTRN